jgi:molybdenum cofactor cytidylyltransferase
MQPMIAILGAGRSRRFGRDKLSQQCAGKPLGRWALDAALATGLPVAWIAGAAAPPFVEGACEVHHNPTAEAGLSTSVACATEVAQRTGHEALLVMLADMPLVDTALLLRLIEHQGTAACRYPDGHPGVPAQFRAELFSSLRRLAGEQGARAFLRGLPSLRLVSCDPEMLLDVDRPEDLARADRLLRSGASVKSSNLQNPGGGLA